LLDLETSAYAKAGERADKQPVRDIFDRGSKVKGLKAEKAKKWFQRWAKWEEANGDKKDRERVTARAQQWAREAESRKRAQE
jgi:rRNA biogenesis protein RRP5